MINRNNNEFIVRFDDAMNDFFDGDETYAHGDTQRESARAIDPSRRFTVDLPRELEQRVSVGGGVRRQWHRSSRSGERTPPPP